jgi:hypothetical protein
MPSVAAGEPNRLGREHDAERRRAAEIPLCLHRAEHVERASEGGVDDRELQHDRPQPGA